MLPLKYAFILRAGRQGGVFRHGPGLVDDDADFEDEAEIQFQHRGNRDQHRAPMNRDEGAGRGRGGGPRDRPRGGGAARGGRRLPVTANLLNQLATREPADIVMTLANGNTGFRDALINCVRNPDMIKLLLKVLALGFTCNSLPNQLNTMTIVIKETRFFDTGMKLFDIRTLSYLKSINFI